MTQKIILITGVSKGIGKSIAQNFLAKGDFVYGISRTKPDFNDENFKWVQGDLANTEFIENLIEKVSHENIDILINNVGNIYRNDSLEFSKEIFEKTFAINLIAPILVTQHLLPKLEKTTIINISSLSDRLPDNDFALYCASKTALNIYFDSIATKYKNLKILHVLPSYVDTPLLRGIIGKDASFNWYETIKPQQVADLVNRLNEKDLPNCAKILVVNNPLLIDAKPIEETFVYNVDTGDLSEQKIMQFDD